MKWFKHQSDAYSNLKMQQMMCELGTEGYGHFWICIELVAQQGKNCRIDAKKCWKKSLLFITRTDEEKMERILTIFAEVELIDKKALNKGDLYIPKLRDYSDDYTNKVRRVSRQSTDSVLLEENRIDKNRKEENILTDFDTFWKAYPRKEGKRPAQKSWKSLNPSKELVKSILEDLELRKKSEQWEDKKFIPHPATYLNQKRWEDEDKPAERKKKEYYMGLEIKRLEGGKIKVIPKDGSAWLDFAGKEEDIVLK